MSTVRVAPEVKDPVVVDGIKYRLREMDDRFAYVRTSFGGLTASVLVDELVWDKVAGVWRVGPVKHCCDRVHPADQPHWLEDVS